MSAMMAVPGAGQKEARGVRGPAGGGLVLSKDAAVDTAAPAAPQADSLARAGETARVRP